MSDEAIDWSCTPRERLRDEFAMAALTGLMVHSTTTRPAFDAEVAYEMADAMLAERSKGREG